MISLEGPWFFFYTRKMLLRIKSKDELIDSHLMTRCATRMICEEFNTDIVFTDKIGVEVAFCRHFDPEHKIEYEKGCLLYKNTKIVNVKTNIHKIILK